MTEHGIVRTFKPSYTVPDKITGKRVKKESSLWLWRFWWHGIKYQGGPGKSTRAEARALGDKRKAEVVGGQETDPRKTTFQSLEAIILAETALQSPKTQTNARGVLGRLKRFFRLDELAMDITRTRLIEYVTFSQGEPWKAQPSTVKLDLKYLHRAFNMAHQDGRLLKVPTFPVIKVQSRAQPFRPGEFTRLLSFMPEHWRRFFLAADEMGWRATSELRTRKRTDVDFEAGFVLLDAASCKTRKARAFPLTVFLRAFLLEQIEWVKAVEIKTGQVIPWLFCQPSGAQLGRHKHVWKRACEKAGLGKLEGRTGPWSGVRVAHDIRGTTLRLWDRLNLPLGARMAVAGHSEQSSHEGYLGGDEETLRAMAEQLDEERRRREGEAEKVIQLDLWKKGQQYT